MQTRIVNLGERVDRGHIVAATTPAWQALREEVLKDPTLMEYFPRWHRKIEEFIAGGYFASHWRDVTLSLRSRDGGLDIAARKRGRQILDQAKAYFHYLRVHLQAVRQGEWKLHLPREKEPPGAAPFSRNVHIAPADRIGFEKPFLVDLENDIGETTDVSGENPQVVERLLELAEGMRDDLGDYDRVGKDMRFFDPLEKRPTKPPVPEQRGPASKRTNSIK